VPRPHASDALHADAFIASNGASVLLISNSSVAASTALTTTGTTYVQRDDAIAGILSDFRADFHGASAQQSSWNLLGRWLTRL
jgi:hypothetical protein